jgi:hypothetical protein
MRCAVLFTSLLLLSTVPLSTNVTASGSDQNSGITFTALFDNSTEMTTLNITMPETNNATLLDELKDETFSIFRILAGDWPVLVETIATDINFCTQGMSNSECSGANFQIEHFPKPSGDHETDDFQYILQSNMTFNVFIISNSVEETVPQTMSVENLSASYSDGVTGLTWDYPTGLDMNHSIMIYSHDSPATRENWDSMPKTIVSSSVPAGATSYQIAHSDNSVERDIYYSVTLLYPTSEDTRFLGSNTLETPVWEDNVAPLFIGELSATFDAETDTTTIDWEEGVQDEDLTINIYRSSMAPETIDPNALVAEVDAAQSSYELEIPLGEHRQSWYAISLQDSQGNEIMELTESSPVSDPVIETTISTTTISGIDAERYVDGTVVISWDDNTNNPNALAKVWRSISGPIDSLDNAEELGLTNLSNEQFSHNPLNAQDEAWYAVTIVAAWGSEQNPWHDERLFADENSQSQPLRETEEELEVVVVNFTSSVMTTTGQRANLSDGAMISLGAMHEGDMIVISTSSPVSNISCQDVDGEGTSLYSQSDWALSFSANQSEEKCLGLIVDGADEIGFILTWDYVETVVEADDDNDEDDNEQDDEKESNKGRSGDDKDTAATVILTIIILALLVYLLVMMRTSEYTEEEE